MLPAVAGATLSTFHVISHDSHRQSPPVTDGYQLVSGWFKLFGLDPLSKIFEIKVTLIKF